MSQVFFQTDKLSLANTYSPAHRARMLVLTLLGEDYATLTKEEVETLRDRLKFWLDMEQVKEVQFEIGGKRLPPMKLGEELPESLEKHPYASNPDFCFGCGFAHSSDYVGCVWNKEV